jgi:hypothetical protein
MVPAGRLLVTVVTVAERENARLVEGPPEKLKAHGQELMDLNRDALSR